MKKQIELTDGELDSLFNKIIDDIIHNLTINRTRPCHLDDIGNWIGAAVGGNTCKNDKDLNIWAFEKDDFISGFNHGYSLQDGTH